MLRKTLRLWVACRFIESKWRCWAPGPGWPDSDIRATNPQDPFYKDIDSLPPYLDYQIASIIIHRILSPLRKDVLRDLQTTFNIHSPKDWFVSFLTSFILLQNYEMQMLFQRQFAARRQARVCQKTPRNARSRSVLLWAGVRANDKSVPGSISRHAACPRHKFGGQDNSGALPLLL